MRLPHLAWGLIRKPQQDLTNEPHNQKARATHGAPYGLSRLFQFRVFQIQLWECRAKRIDDAFGFQVARPEEDIPRQHCASQKCDHVRKDPQCQAMIITKPILDWSMPDYLAEPHLKNQEVQDPSGRNRIRAIQGNYRERPAPSFVYLAVKLASFC